MSITTHGHQCNLTAFVQDHRFWIQYVSPLSCMADLDLHLAAELLLSGFIDMSLVCIRAFVADQHQVDEPVSKGSAPRGRLAYLYHSCTTCVLHSSTSIYNLHSVAYL